MVLASATSIKSLLVYMVRATAIAGSNGEQYTMVEAAKEISGTLQVSKPSAEALMNCQENAQGARYVKDPNPNGRPNPIRYAMFVILPTCVLTSIFIPSHAF